LENLLTVVFINFHTAKLCTGLLRGKLNKVLGIFAYLHIFLLSVLSTKQQRTKPAAAGPLKDVAL
jgi:hypothetical protein